MFKYQFSADLGLPQTFKYPHNKYLFMECLENIRGADRKCLRIRYNTAFKTR